MISAPHHAMSVFKFVFLKELVPIKMDGVNVVNDYRFKNKERNAVIQLPSLDSSILQCCMSRDLVVPLLIHLDFCL